MRTRNKIQKVKRRNKGVMDLRGNKVRNKRKNKEKKEPEEANKQKQEHITKA